MKKKVNFYLVAVLFLAILLRFWKLGQVPHGMTWDEAAIAYNGFAIRTVHRDEWLEFMPISFRSFGDYKAPLAIYLNGLFTWIFGMNLFAIRLPFAIASIFAILGIYLLIKELFYTNKNKEFLATLASFVLTLSPWHIHYSRLGFESGIALSFLIWTFYFLQLYLRKRKLWILLVASFLAVLNIYTYHSGKVTVPLLVISFILFNWKFFKKKWKELLLAGGFSILLLIPFFKDAIWGEGLTRANSSIFSNGLSFLEVVKTFFSNFASYFSFKFLVKGENGGILRHSDGKFGVLNLASFSLLIFYLFILIKKLIKKEKIANKKELLLGITWILLGFLPAVIADGKYHSNRSLLALPGFMILVILAFLETKDFFKVSLKKLAVVFAAFYLFFTSLYQYNYYQNYAKISAGYFVDGYIDVFQYLKSLDKSGVEKILFTADYQQAYIYALLVNKLSPIAYNGGILAVFEFADKINSADLERKNTIVVASKYDDMGQEKEDHQILGSDDEVRFRIYLPQEK